jgi:hypothetical protein
MVRTCAICAKDHVTEQCPSLPGLKFIFKREEEETEPIYLMAQRLQWKARPSSTLQHPYLFPGQYNQQHNPINTWQSQPFLNTN